MKSMYTQKEKATIPDNSDFMTKSFQTNKEIIKTNQMAKSLYDLKRPRINKPFRTKENSKKTNNPSMKENQIEEEED